MDQVTLDAGNLLTHEHISMVRKFMTIAIMELQHRADFHDASKLEAPEAEMFAEFGPKLRGMTYDPNNPDSEYEKCREQMGEALKHHYAHNTHHPEHFEHGVDEMNLLDVLEMFCDWMAATMRHDDGDIVKSIVKNMERFKLSPQLAQILKNTVLLVEDLAEDPATSDTPQG